MNKLNCILFVIGWSNLFPLNQSDSILIEIVTNLEYKVNQQQVDIQSLYSELGKEYRTYQIVREDLSKTILTKQQEVIDSLNTLIEKSNQKLASVNQQLELKILEAGQESDSQIAQLDSRMGNTRLYWIVVTLLIFLLGGVVYWLLAKQIASSKTDVETQIKNTKLALEEEGIQLDSKLVEVLETQLKLQQEDAKVQVTPNSEEVDHSLALKVADEIVRMQKNISRMDQNTKGLKPLLKGIERIQANFAANGYEMVNLMNKKYDERMNIDIINFNVDDNLAIGEKVISKIIKPQVNFNGILIQRAQVEVSQN